MIISELLGSFNKERRKKLQKILEALYTKDPGLWNQLSFSHEEAGFRIEPIEYGDFYYILVTSDQDVYHQYTPRHVASFIQHVLRVTRVASQHNMLWLKPTYRPVDTMDAGAAIIDRYQIRYTTLTGWLKSQTDQSPSPKQSKRKRKR